MKKIPLTRGLFALVDDADYDKLSLFKWYASKNKATFYAIRGTFIGGKRGTVSMHRTILGAACTGWQIDHSDGDGLNNQRANLRLCSSAENMQNRRLVVRNASGLRGVSTPPSRERYATKYRAKIIANGKYCHLGYFLTAEEAHAAYCEAAKKLHGKFARFE